MEMINIINENKARKQETKRIENAKRRAKKERFYNVLVIAGYAIAFSIFVEIVCLLVK
jgi:hypothetical protein